GDRFIARTLQESDVPAVIAVNKIDGLDRGALLKALSDADELGVGEAIFPISAKTGDGLGELLEHLRGLMPEGAFMYTSDAVSDQPQALLLAELIREAAVRRTFHDVPHAVEVVIEDLERPRPDLARVRALVWVETESQKGILIGAGGRMIKAIGTAARREL